MIPALALPVGVPLNDASSYTLLLKGITNGLDRVSWLLGSCKILLESAVSGLRCVFSFMDGEGGGAPCSGTVLPYYLKGHLPKNCDETIEPQHTRPLPFGANRYQP